MVESEPTELSFEFTTAMHPDAQQLIQRLSDTLNQRVGDSGKSSFKDADPDPFVIARLDNEPVGCGAFREHSADTAEIKRMYAQVPGVGKQILKVLEESIRRKGYIRVILSTRKKNDHAMAFYLRQGYVPCEPFGKYRFTDLSQCFEKFLT